MNRSSEWAPRAAPGNGPGALDIRGVTVRFGGVTALDSVSFSAAPRQVTGVIGPNGAGKTTLLNVACGFVRPGAGTLTFGGVDLTGRRPHDLASLGIARTLQNVGLFPGLTALENVMAGANRHARAGFWPALAGLSRSDNDERALRKRAMAALDQVGVAQTADRLPGQLSYAHRKRVALARALAAQPRLLLLDEPASGLTETELPELGELITTFAANASVVVIEHRMDLMMSVCDTIAVLDFGKLIAFGTPARVQADPAVTEAYLGAERSPGGQPERPGDAPQGGAAPGGEPSRGERDGRADE